MSTKDQSTSRKYLPHIDGLRGLAVFVILMFHLDFTAFKGGFIGVDIFFVISGFLITSIITREMEEGCFSFANFYARRIRRIFPALFFMLLLTSAAAVFILGLQQFGAFFEAMRKASAQISNFHFAQAVDYFDTGNDLSPLLHTWSLGVEEQFYVVWPLILLFTQKFLGSRRWVITLLVLTAASLGISEYLVRTDTMSAFYFLHARAWQLALGGLIALNALPEITKKSGAEATGIIGVLCILAAVFLYDETNFPGIKAALPCIGAALYIHSARATSGYIHKLFSFKPLVYIGLISYSLYLWHWPVIAFYKNYFVTDLTLPIQGIMLALSLILAIISFTLIEQPFRRIQAKPWKIIIAGLLVIGLFVIFGNVIKRHSDAGWRVNYEVTEHVRDPHKRDKVCAGEGGAFNRKKCIIGPDKDKYQVILVGDSHASHYTPTVLGWAHEKGLTVRIFLRGACQTWVDKQETIYRLGKVDDYCMDLTKAFYETLEQDESIQYIFLGLYMPKDEADIKHSLEKIAGFKKKTYYLGQVPIFKQDPHQCQIKNHLLISKWFPRPKSEDCMTLDHNYSNEKIAKSLDGFKPLLEEQNINYFDPIPYLQSPLDAEKRFMYLDTNHLNRYGAKHLIDPLIEYMDTTDH